MFGILLLLFFLVMGYLFAEEFLGDQDILIKLWAGGVLGLILLMAGMIPFGFLLGYTVCAHLLLIVCTAACYALIRYLNRGKPRTGFIAQLKVSTMRHMLWVTVPLGVLICALMFTHVLLPSAAGLTGGQSSYGDLAMHLGMATSIAEQRAFPPTYSILSGTRLSYPFLVDAMSASLMIFGLPLRWAFLLPDFVFAFLLPGGFYILAYTVLKRKAGAVLAVLLFFFNGGFGFAYFLESAKVDPTLFSRIFTAFYKTPTNLNEMNIRWSNTICDMIVPQRTTMAGWAVLLFALYLLYRALTEKKCCLYVLLAAAAAAMPMIHTHSFLALGIVSAVAFFAYIAQELEPEKRRRFVINWLIYGGIVLVFSFPQLFYWTFSQAHGESFIKAHFDWVNKNDPYLWFWLKNVGVVLLLLIPAFLAADKKLRRFYAPFIGVFIIAELLLFQPNDYDNNKLFYVWYMASVILVGGYMAELYGKLKQLKGTVLLACVMLFFCFFSSALTVGREFSSTGEFVLFDKADVAAADFIQENTQADSVFITGEQHLNPVAALSGRNIYLGSPVYLYFHGFSEDIATRRQAVREVYESDTAIGILAEEYGFDYVYLSSYEYAGFAVNAAKLKDLPVVYSENGIVIYKAR